MGFTADQIQQKRGLGYGKIGQQKIYRLKYGVGEKVGK